MIHTSTHAHLSEATREMLRALLAPKILDKTHGAFEIGQENIKSEIKHCLEIFTKGPL